MADYTTIFKRLSRMEMDLRNTIKPRDEPVVIAIDSTCVKVTNRRGVDEREVEET